MNYDNLVYIFNSIKPPIDIIIESKNRLAAIIINLDVILFSLYVFVRFYAKNQKSRDKGMFFVLANTMNLFGTSITFVKIAAFLICKDREFTEKYISFGNIIPYDLFVVLDFLVSIVFSLSTEIFLFNASMKFYIFLALESACDCIYPYNSGKNDVLVTVMVYHIVVGFLYNVVPDFSLALVVAKKCIENILYLLIMIFYEITGKKYPIDGFVLFVMQVFATGVIIPYAFSIYLGNNTPMC